MQQYNVYAKALPQNTSPARDGGVSANNNRGGLPKGGFFL